MFWVGTVRHFFAVVLLVIFCVWVCGGVCVCVKIFEETFLEFCVFIFILRAISSYTTGLKALFNPYNCTGTVPTHK